MPRTTQYYILFRLKTQRSVRNYPGDGKGASFSSKSRPTSTGGPSFLPWKQAEARKYVRIRHRTLCTLSADGGLSAALHEREDQGRRLVAFYASFSTDAVYLDFLNSFAPFFVSMLSRTLIRTFPLGNSAKSAISNTPLSSRPRSCACSCMCVRTRLGTTSFYFIVNQ